MHALLRTWGLLALAAVVFAGDPRLKVLILTGETDLPYHDWRLTTPALRAMLEAAGGFEVRVAERIANLGPADLAPYDVLLLNYNGPRWSPATEAAVEEFVASGKGMFSFHGASYGRFFGMVYDKHWEASPSGDRGWLAYPRLIGATWDPPKIGHAPRHVFAVKWVDREHPIARGLDATFAADDELYHSLTLLAQTHVVAAAFDDSKTGGTGRDEPIAWTAPFGKGRIAYCTLGHDVKALDHPGVAALFTRAVRWAGTR